jgi:hypothetical protein
MRVERSEFMTSVSRFAVVLAISACSQRSAATFDAPPATSLAGPVACGSASCGSGQLCYAQAAGIADAGITYQCATVAAGCTVFDCSGSACPACAIDTCWYWPELADLFAVMARTVRCEGE